MAIAEVAGPSPAFKTSDTGTPLTSAAFTPPDGSLVLVLTAEGWSNSGTTTIATTSSNGGTWTNAAVSNNSPSAYRGAAYVTYRYFATSPGSITVTSTASYGGSNHNTFLQSIVVLTGVDATTPIGNTAAVTIGSTTSSTTAFTTSLTTTVAGSRVYGAGSNGSASNDMTGVSGFQNIDVYNNTGEFAVTGKSSSDTVTPGATTVGWTSASTGGAGVIAFAEILPGVTGPVDKPVTDSGTGTDTASVSKIVLIGTENGAGSDNSSVIATNTVTESGNTTDTAFVHGYFTVSDSGNGTEAAVSTNPVFVTDQISGSDNAVLVLDQVRPAIDSATAVENAFVSKATFFVADSISATEAGEKSALFTPLPEARLIRVLAENRTFRVKEEK